MRKSLPSTAASLLLLVTFMFPGRVLLAQQQGVISGVVTDNEGQALPFITVAVQQSALGAVTDESGYYAISPLAPGKYVIAISGTGYKGMTKEVQVPHADTLKLSVKLQLAYGQMQQVEVVGRRESSYKNTLSFAGTKTATELSDIPQSISYVTKEVLDDQLAFKTSDAIKNVSGVNQYSYNNNDFVLRGFRSSNTLVNGLRISTRGWAQNLLPYVERIEVIKGPASALFANTDPGGTINTVTKKPLDEARRSINFVTGSFNTYRAAIDFTGPMNASKTLLYRLNVAYQNAESFRILQDGNAMVIAPSFSFIPNEKTRVNVDLVYQFNRGRLDRGQPIFGASQGVDLHSVPTSFAIGRKNDFQKELNLFSTISLQHQFTEHISFNLAYLKSFYDEDLLEHRTSNSYGVDVDGNEIPYLMGMQTIRRMRKNYVDNVTAYFTFRFHTAALEHQLLAGYDHIRETFPKGNSTYNASGFLNAAGTGTIRTYNPAQRDRYMIVDNMPVPNVPYFNLQDPDYSISEIANYINVSQEETPSRYFVHGVYVQDQVKWRRFHLLLALRQEFYTDISGYQTDKQRNIAQKALIPRVGLVYKPMDNLSLYGTYTQGYQPQGAGTIGDPETYGGPFDPLSSNMLEAGAKLDLFHHRLSLTTSVYQIEQNNILINALDPANPDRLRQLGQQRARGVEFDVNGRLTNDLSVAANFSYNHGIITQSDNDAEIGAMMPNAPRSQGSLWLKYRLPLPMLKGIELAAGSNYATTRNTDNVLLRLPGYQLVNTAVYYRVDKFRFGCNVNNVFNKTYWVGGFDYVRLFPGAPRNFLISIGYVF